MTQPDAPCRHHWKIATPDGRRMLPGRCKHCPAERLFRAADATNYWEDYSIGGNSPLERKLGSAIYQERHRRYEARMERQRSGG